MPLSPTRDLLDHSFYRRWLAGTLALDELRDYALQYEHVVRALPAWLRLAADHTPGEAEGLHRHAEEEERHVALWHQFGGALGLTEAEMEAARPNAATQALLDCAGSLAAEPAGVAVAWAVESQSAPVSREKLHGLADRYGIAGGGAEYFRLHSALDEAHTAELDALVERLSPAELERAQFSAGAIQDGLWDLLSSVEHAA